VEPARATGAASRRAPPRLRLHALAARSLANGPGARAVIWLQGCTLACPGCFNPATHAEGPLPDPPEPGGRGLWSADQLVTAVTARADRIEGVTVSGGEPLQQAEGLLAFLDALHAWRAPTAARPPLSVLLFSGYTRAEILALAHGPAILARVDVLIDGRYRAGERLAAGLRGSANQQIHLLSDRYRLEQVEAAPPAEIAIGPDGAVVVTGIDPPRLR
jgi:anaerobic ribonucleoside-triphosphate reductase activating protein